jgi:hypothetical protein
MRSFPDSTFGVATDSSWIELRNGEIHSRGTDASSLAVEFTGTSIRFARPGQPSGGYTFSRVSADEWTATLHPRSEGGTATVYTMRRIAPSDAQAPGVILGEWRVTGSRCRSECALAPATAQRFHGGVAVFAGSRVRFGEDTCNAARFTTGYWPASGRYGGSRLADFGIVADSAIVVQVRCPESSARASDPRWMVPGSFLLVRDADHLIAIWEGVWFELARQQT